MKKAISGAAVLLMTAAPVLAGGIERAPQSLATLFEPGENYVELSFGRANPKVSGKDDAIFGGSSFGDVAENYSFFGLSYKRQFNDNLSAALIIEQPFGADLLYPSESIALGGTAVTVDSTTFTALLRYKMDNNFGVHAGIRGSRADANVTLKGAAYAGLNGYNLETDTDTAVGWVAGVSWEKPEIAARVSLTYNSKVNHKFDTKETLNGNPFAIPVDFTNPAAGLYGPEGEMEVDTPDSLNLEFQTGVAPDTLVFGSVRWVNWSEFKVSPPAFSNTPVDPTAPFGEKLGSLVDLEDTTTYTIGVGRKFTENWSGSAAFSFEKAGDDLVSPLAPTNGRKGITLAGIYTNGNIKITTGINYSKLGDADPETGTPDRARAYMRDNDVVGVGVRVGFTF